CLPPVSMFCRLDVNTKSLVWTNVKRKDGKMTAKIIPLHFAGKQIPRENRVETSSPDILDLTTRRVSLIWKPSLIDIFRRLSMYAGPRKERLARNASRKDNQTQDVQEKPIIAIADAQKEIAKPAEKKRTSRPTRTPKAEDKPQRKSKTKTHYALAALAFALAAIGLFLNATYSFTRGSTDADKLIMCALGFTIEAVLFFLPAQAV